MRSLKQDLLADPELKNLWQENLSADQLERLAQGLNAARHMQVPHTRHIVSRNSRHLWLTQRYWLTATASVVAILIFMVLPQRNSIRDNQVVLSDVPTYEQLDLQPEDLSLDVLQFNEVMPEEEL